MNIRLLTLAGLATLASANVSHAAVFADKVIDYQPGSGASLTDPLSALGQPYHTVGEGSGFDAPLTLFNPHYEGGQLVQIGEGGSLTLRLANFAVPSAGLAEIGIFANVGIIDTDFPNGSAGDPIGTFGADAINLEVSESGSDWIDIGSVLLDQPASYHSDTAATQPSDFGQSHSNAISDYAGQNFAGILSQLNGSAGGTWLDLDASGLSQIGYLRFSVADDNDANTSLTAEIDAVAIENRAVGAAIPEPSAVLLAAISLLLFSRRRR